MVLLQLCASSTCNFANNALLYIPNPPAEYVPASQVEGAVVLGEAAPSGLPLSGEGHADQLSAALDALAVSV